MKRTILASTLVALIGHTVAFAHPHFNKTVTAKLDDQTGANRKAFADQKLQIDNVAEGVRVLREKADDTNVRLSSVSQELEAVRQAISSTHPILKP